MAPMMIVRLAFVLMIAAVAFVVAAALLSANARPEPGPCNDTVIIELPADDSGVVPARPAPMCAAPEAPGWLVVGGGAAAAGFVVVAYALLVRGRGRTSGQPAPRVS